LIKRSIIDGTAVFECDQLSACRSQLRLYVDWLARETLKALLELALLHVGPGGKDQKAVVVYIEL